MTAAAGPWVCATCGSRAVAAGECCGEPRLDMDDHRVRDLLRDIDLRAEQRRETRIRFLAVVVGIAVVVAAWAIPGYWDFRQIYGLPFLADQWLLMVLVAFGVIKLFPAARKRFPFVDDTAD